MPDPAPAQLDAAAASRLRRLNVIVGSVHALQAVVLLAIATAASLPITASFLTGPPGAGDYGSASLGSVRIDWLVAAFLLLAAVDHLTLSGGRPRRWYEANVARGINPARWWEYSLSASLMVVLIAMLAGVSELVALIALFGANAAMILFGLVQEQTNADRDEVDWRPFIYGCVIGAVPWIAITAQLIVSTTDGNGVPGFVVAIFITPVPALQHVRGQHVAAVPRARPLGGPGVRRARLPDPQPRRQERAGLAGLRRRARRRLSEDRSWGAPDAHLVEGDELDQPARSIETSKPSPWRLSASRSPSNSPMRTMPSKYGAPSS